MTREHHAALAGVELSGTAAVPCLTCHTWQERPGVAVAAATTWAWIEAVRREWDECAYVALEDDRPVGLVLVLAPHLAPGAAARPTAPVSPDALRLAALRVVPDARGHGVGRLLVRAALRTLVDRDGVRALEAFGTTIGSPCLIPADYLRRQGFHVQRPHPSTPRLRLDLRAAVSWREELGAAVDRVVEVVRPRREPGAPTVRDARWRGAERVATTRGDQPTNSSRSRSSAAFGFAPTIERTTSPPW